MKEKNPAIVSAYHRGRWVYVPLFFIPEEAIDENGELHFFRFIPVDDQNLPEPSPKRSCEAADRYSMSNAKESILPWMLSENELKELCTRNFIPLNWVVSRLQKSPSNKKIILHLLGAHIENFIH